MKIHCDVCCREEAAVFCCADEAALCVGCDRSVHHANKLAGKHRRLPLLLPSTADSPSDHTHPLCDICQEKRGFVFCKEDRAILCKDCDEPIHSANQLTMKHCRFLLTGARLSATPIPTSAPAEPPPSAEHTTGSTSSNSSSSISEYLIKMLPGWCVEDLLVDDAAAAAAAAADSSASKKDELSPLMESDLDTFWPVSGAEELPIWVPQVPQLSTPDHSVTVLGTAAVTNRHMFRQSSVKNGPRVRRVQLSDDGFTVPQISPSLHSSKKSKPSVWYF